MVSLSSERTFSGGYFGFSNEFAPVGTATADDDLLSDHIDVVLSPELSHRPIKTTWVIVLVSIVYILLAFSTFVIPVLCDNSRCRADPLSLVLYVHAGVWFLLFYLDRLLQCQHNKSRRLGYLSFYRSTWNVRKVSLLVNSCANAILVAMIKLLDSHCDPHGYCRFLSKIRCVQLVIIVESSVALLSLVIYLVQTFRFNTSKPLPDVAQPDLTASFENSYWSVDQSYRTNHLCSQVLGQQADMIRYLQQHAKVLAKKSLSLTAEVNTLKTPTRRQTPT